MDHGMGAVEKRSGSTPVLVPIPERLAGEKRGRGEICPISKPVSSRIASTSSVRWTPIDSSAWMTGFATKAGLERAPFELPQRPVGPWGFIGRHLDGGDSALARGPARRGLRASVDQHDAAIIRELEVDDAARLDAERAQAGRNA
ncbi:MAG: hypothetical protein ACREJ5_23650 [Geminicoccaceae bacterium]